MVYLSAPQPSQVLLNDKDTSSLALPPPNSDRKHVSQPLSRVQVTLTVCSDLEASTHPSDPSEKRTALGVEDTKVL